LPSSPQPTQIWDRYAVRFVNILNTGSEGETEEADDSEIDAVTSNTPFVGVASQSRAKSVISYYGVENHSKWVFTPMFRGSGAFNANQRPTPPPPGNSRTRSNQVVTP
jgi:hypothetical protein